MARPPRLAIWQAKLAMLAYDLQLRAQIFMVGVVVVARRYTLGTAETLRPASCDSCQRGRTVSPSMSVERDDPKWFLGSVDDASPPTEPKSVAYFSANLM